MNSRIGAGILGAFKIPANVLLLAASLAGSVIARDPLPIAIGLAVETVYLIFVAIRASGVHLQIVADTESAQAEAASPSSAQAAIRNVRLSPTQTDDLRPELTSQCSTIDSLARLIALKVGASTPSETDLTHKLDRLRQRHADFCRREMQLRSMLRHLVAESKRTMAGPNVLPEPAGPAAQIVLAMPANDSQTAAEFAHDMAAQAHAEFERALREVAFRREAAGLNGHASDLDRVAQAIIKRNRYVDRLAKTLINLHYEMQLIVRKFEEVRIEVGSGNDEHILADVNALLLQADSVSRTLEDLEPATDHLRRASASAR